VGLEAVWRNCVTTIYALQVFFNTNSSKVEKYNCTIYVLQLQMCAHHFIYKVYNANANANATVKK